MPVAIDTSILIAAEKAGDLEAVLSGIEEGIYVPAHAAAEFLVGTHPPVREDLRWRAQRLYESHIRSMVDSFDEKDAAQLAALNAELRRTGRTMKFFDAAIAATVLARGDKLLAADGDYDRLAERMVLLKA
jgi:predicted nucleic acid-binding protein